MIELTAGQIKDEWFFDCPRCDRPVRLIGTEAYLKKQGTNEMTFDCPFCEKEVTVCLPV